MIVSVWYPESCISGVKIPRFLWNQDLLGILDRFSPNRRHLANGNDSWWVVAKVREAFCHNVCECANPHSRTYSLFWCITNIFAYQIEKADLQWNDSWYISVFKAGEVSIGLKLITNSHPISRACSQRRISLNTLAFCFHIVAAFRPSKRLIEQLTEIVIVVGNVVTSNGEIQINCTAGILIDES